MTDRQTLTEVPGSAAAGPGAVTAVAPGGALGRRTRRGAVRPARSRRWAWIWGLTSGLIMLAGWELISLRFPDYLLPGVPETLRATWEIVRDSSGEIGVTLTRLLTAMGIAMAGGWLLGLLMSIRVLGALVQPMLKVASAIPFVSWVLLAVLWVTSIEVRVTFVCVVLVLPVFAINVYEGVRTFDPELVQAVGQFGPGRWQFMRYVLIPNSFADVLLTTRSMTGFALRILVFAELIGANNGVGNLMSDAQSNFRVDHLLGLTIVMIASTLALLGIASAAERYLLRWRPESAVS
jgi:NitT/TauT family transport system permease protein